MKKVVLMLAIFGIYSLSAQEKSTENDLIVKIDNYLKAGIENGFSGALLVAKEGRILINNGYGIANKEKGILNTPNTVFDIGSNTKQFTGVAILKLVSLNKLQLIDSISEFFKNLPKDKKDITIHQLLTHSGGFVESIGRDFDNISREEFFQKVFESDLLHKPGSTYSYSNIGYSILARIIELISSLDYESFIIEYLFKPADMLQTGYTKAEWNNDLFAIGYARNVLNRSKRR